MSSCSPEGKFITLDNQEISNQHSRLHCNNFRDKDSRFLSLHLRLCHYKFFFDTVKLKILIMKTTKFSNHHDLDKFYQTQYILTRKGPQLRFFSENITHPSQDRKQVLIHWVQLKKKKPHKIWCYLHGLKFLNFCKILHTKAKVLC